MPQGPKNHYVYVEWTKGFHFYLLWDLTPENSFVLM